MGGRLDNLQAAILNVKLKYYEKDMERRQVVAQNYTLLLNEFLPTPQVMENATAAKFFSGRSGLKKIPTACVPVFAWAGTVGCTPRMDLITPVTLKQKTAARSI